jgi:Arc/MetJ family transcription regulator
MPAERRKALKRKAFFVDEKALQRAKRALGVETESEAVRLSLERIAEMEEFWRFMERTHGAVERDSFSG